jgi:hypothetical protein
LPDTSRHVGGSHFSLVDGSARFLSERVDWHVLKALSTRAGGEGLGSDW